MVTRCGAPDEVSLRENHSAFHRIWLRPRVLVDVSRVDPSTKILGHGAAMPVFVSATALARLADPIGEGGHVCQWALTLLPPSPMSLATRGAHAHFTYT